MHFTLCDRSSRLAELIKAIRKNRTAIPALDRVDLADSLREYLDGQPGGEVIELMGLLADDPTPEVRHAIAHLLHLVADEDFPALYDKLKDDWDAFVQRTTARAGRMREKARRAARRKPLGLDQITRQLAELEKRHGVPAARFASQLCGQSVDTLVSSMVHDLQTIAVAAKATTAAMALDDGSRRTELLGRLEGVLDQFQRTVTDMDQFTKPLTVERAIEELRPIVKEARDVTLASLRASGCAVPEGMQCRIHVPATIRVRVARHLIVTALANVIRNAYEACMGRRACEGPFEIVVEARESGGRLLLDIRDNGPGLSPQAAKSLSACVPGRRNKAKRTSTGYGLPNAMRQIAAHDGTLEITSTAHRGTTVRITLPREFRTND
jgi:signal transduction histidine kinase